MSSKPLTLHAYCPACKSSSVAVLDGMTYKRHRACPKSGQPVAPESIQRWFRSVRERRMASVREADAYAATLESVLEKAQRDHQMAVEELRIKREELRELRLLAATHPDTLSELALRASEKEPS